MTASQYSGGHSVSVWGDWLHRGSVDYDVARTRRVPRQTARLNLALRRFCIVTAILIFFTSSFDIFLVLNAGGNYRFCQMILPPLAALAGLKVWLGRRIPVLGFVSLCIWCAFQLVFIPATDFWPKSVGYCLWLLLNMGMVYAFVQLFSEDAEALRTLLRWYLFSFAFVAAFGIVQFIFPILGLPGMLVAQWWIPDSLARVNGFSYEPSYFASYLLIGFVLNGSLKRARSTLLSSKAFSAIQWLTAIAIVISSSRMGIVFLLADVLLVQSKPWPAVFSDLRRRRIVRAKLAALVPSLLSISLVGILAGGTLILAEDNPLFVLVFLNGTGVSDTAAHSVVQREDALGETFEVFVQHPLIGRSLGGMSAAIAEIDGGTIRSFDDAKTTEGMCVFAEVLAASGIAGFIPFVWFVAATIRKPWKLAATAPPFYASLLHGFVRALVFAWAILQFNQNVLRPYLWIHVALLATVYAASLRAAGKQPDLSCAPGRQSL